MSKTHRCSFRLSPCTRGPDEPSGSHRQGRSAACLERPGAERTAHRALGALERHDRVTVWRDRGETISLMNRTRESGEVEGFAGHHRAAE